MQSLTNFVVRSGLWTARSMCQITSGASCNGLLQFPSTRRFSTTEKPKKMADILLPYQGAVLSKTKSRKVTVVGTGSVGMAVAYAILARGIVNKLALVDVAEERAKGEAMDMIHGKQFVGFIDVAGGSDYKLSADSDIIFVTAGARQMEGESRLNLLQRNVDIFKTIIPPVAKHSPNGIIVVVSNPVDIMTYVSAKLSGFPTNRVTGTGTILDTARFRHLLGEALGLSALSVQALIIGEHGDSSVPVWSKANVAGVSLSSINPAVGKPNDPEKFHLIHKEVVQSAYEIIRMKGQTNAAIGLCCMALANSIFTDSHTIYPLSVGAKGLYGIKHDIYLSLPALVTHNGVTHIIPPELDEDETAKLHQSADTLAKVCESIKW